MKNNIAPAREFHLGILNDEYFVIREGEEWMSAERLSEILGCTSKKIALSKIQKIIVKYPGKAKKAFFKPEGEKYEKVHCNYFATLMIIMESHGAASAKFRNEIAKAAVEFSGFKQSQLKEIDALIFEVEQAIAHYSLSLQELKDLRSEAAKYFEEAGNE